ncbi:LPS-assembly protein LptD [Pseudooceanicola sp. 502str34]
MTLPAPTRPALPLPRLFPRAHRPAKRWLALLLAALLPPLTAFPPLPVLAQATPVAGVEESAALLMADRVYLRDRDTLVAEGNVEAVYGEMQLSAAKVTYERATGKLSIEGPLYLTRGADQKAVVLADAAELDRDFRNGILSGAHVVLNQQVQLAAQQMNRVNGRYNQLYKATVTSCHVCENGKPPLWQIRARRVVHDEADQALYFDHAQFQVMGVPILYLPRLRLPDPTQTRASGFLIPSLRRNSELGTGVKIPYFLTLGEYRDMTITPYLAQNSDTLELTYRQNFTNGAISFEGAVTKDELEPGETRAYLFGTGRFDLPRDYKLSFAIQTVTDDAYLTDYDYSDADRLASNLTLARTERDENIRAALTYYHTLRENEVNSQIPSIIGDVTYERRYFPRTPGGELRMTLGAHTHYRYSDVNTDGSDYDSYADGRDVTRYELEANWRRAWILPVGVHAELQTGAAVDHFETRQDVSLPSSDTGVTPYVAGTLRMPLVRRGAGGVIDVIEPVLQFAWSGGEQLDVSNDESAIVEFDEGNLLSLSRFAAPDRREHGRRLTLGTTWTRYDPSGWNSTLALGKILRETSEQDYSDSSGLTGTGSDLLLAYQVAIDNGLTVTARGLFYNAFDVHKAEARAAWRSQTVGLAASYVWIEDDPDESRFNDISEWTIDASYRFAPNWTGEALWRYDIVQDQTARAGFGVSYQNECVDMRFSVSRRFTSSSTVTPSTDFAFTIGLRGFQAEADGVSYDRTCK